MAHIRIHCGGRCSCDHDIRDIITGLLPLCTGCGCDDEDEWDDLEDEEDEKITDPFSKGSLDY